ncbi:hypothetical protein Mmc1_1458 [Magnetococcus marinus MC-1]|uniref:Transposase Helix-turn-helix domain-containing protein n=1 Tax=Magnetococcus marinus (strain ATCC BAA-1437 / JCM 17883 / MC-1) TaxID=156889 RepID=A0L7M4_MAGMM|nr:transposase family protein [Magnetococcus marinus]ABK43967.1 hypothetical protein Mmc1_1458 [Magnetococcus marinus MC-1]
MSSVRSSKDFSYQRLMEHPLLFETLLGCSVEVMQKEVEALRPAWNRSMKNKKVTGRPHALPDLENHLLALMLYYRARVTYYLIGNWLGVNETTALRRIKWIEPLVKQRGKLIRYRCLSREQVQAIIDEMRGQAGEPATPTAEPSHHERL